MTPRNDPSALQIVLDELREFRQEMRGEVSETKQLALDAHRRLDAQRNRMLGIGVGAGVSGTGLGVWLQKFLPGLFP